jgi:hypothetical protein
MPQDLAPAREECFMAKKVVAIVGSYRKDGTTEAAVDAILEGSREGGVQTTKIRLIEKRVEFCTNCRSCTQIPGRERGWCIQKDDLESILGEIDRSDGVVLASPVNFYDVTAVFRRFMERLIGYSYWPWGLWIPMLRVKKPSRRAVLVSSGGMPGFLLPLATGAPRALRRAAKMMGAEPVGTLWIGRAAMEKPRLSARVAAKARALGARLA